MTVAPFTLALCQIDTIPGDVPRNLARIASAVRRARDGGAGIALLPELALVGYCPRDLLLRSDLLDGARSALAHLAAEFRDGPAILVGTVIPNGGVGRPLINAAILLHEGSAQTVFEKQLLPTYDVFDEDRYFEPASPGPVITLHGVRIGVAICEDLWTGPLSGTGRRHHRDPAADLAARGVDLILSPSASPFERGKPALRSALMAEVARRTGATVALCNLVGAQEEVLFDGGSLVVSKNGDVLARSPLFEEDVRLVDITRSGDVATWPSDEIEEIETALVAGIRGYARKTGFQTAALGLSGGIDSAVVAVLACKALSPQNVRGLTIPGPYSSKGSVDDATDLAQRLGMRCDTVPIIGAYDELTTLLLPLLEPGPFGITEQNLQARLRGVLLMALSNRENALLLATSNKSEVAVGYSTLYGDMCGGLAPIGDLLKRDVYALGARFFEEGLLPRASLEKAPSAELAPNQKDEDSLPPYDQLDRILSAHIERGLGQAEILIQVPDVEEATVARVLKLVARSEYKRKQAAPVFKVTGKAFGCGRRIPIVASDLGWTLRIPWDAADFGDTNPTTSLAP